MPRGGRRRGRGGRRRSGNAERAPATRAESAPEELGSGKSRSARRRRARRAQSGGGQQRSRASGGGQQRSATEAMAVARPRTLQTLPPDGVLLEDLISDLQTEYGTPTTPQEFRLLIKLPEGSGQAVIAPAGEPPRGIDEEDGYESQTGVGQESSENGEAPVRRSRRRRRRRRGGPRPAEGAADSSPAGDD